jgi:hypothetical protein
MKNCGGNKYEAFWKWVPKGSQCKCGNKVDNWQCLNCDYCNPKGNQCKCGNRLDNWQCGCGRYNAKGVACKCGKKPN